MKSLCPICCESTNWKYKKISNNELCSICYDKDNKNFGQLKCGHCYCLNCINTMKNISKSQHELKPLRRIVFTRINNNTEQWPMFQTFCLW
jgi:late competence protein required for DNA uptake (superfamily II DNA/RNA helicase)